MTDRGLWFARDETGLNVRRLMYQSLIWLSVAGNGSSSLRAPFDAEYLEGLPDSLVHGVRGDVELGCDFLRVQVLVDKEEAIELALA
jgi:hypothetical protein